MVSLVAWIFEKMLVAILYIKQIILSNNYSLLYFSESANLQKKNHCVKKYCIFFYKNYIKITISDWVLCKKNILMESNLIHRWIWYSFCYAALALVVWNASTSIFYFHLLCVRLPVSCLCSLVMSVLAYTRKSLLSFPDKVGTFFVYVLIVRFCWRGV